MADIYEEGHHQHAEDEKVVVLTGSRQFLGSSNHVGSLCLDDAGEVAELERLPQSHNLDLHNDISQQTKGEERTYVPAPWTNAKLKAIKKSSTLSSHLHVTPESVKTTGNVVSMQIVTASGLKGTLELIFFAGGIMKINCINLANPSKFSFELVEKPFNLMPCDVSSNVKVTESSVEIDLVDAKVRYVVQYNPFTVQMFATKDGANDLMFQVNANKSLNFDEHLTCDFTFHTECLYGIPGRATDLLLEDTKAEYPYRFYNQDLPAFPVGTKNNIYSTVPVIVSRSKKSPTIVSMYWQNCSDTYTEIHKEEKENKVYWMSERGNLECYLFLNYTAVEYYRSLANLLGHCAMPQYFALGYHQCRWSYENEAEVMMLNDKFNEYEIPCDSITLVIDHTDGCRYFTWNSELFPDPIRMQKVLAANGRQLITIADPHIKIDPEYHVYIEAATQGLYVKNKEHHPFVGKCWPGDSIYLDFLNEETRNMWASQYSYDKYKYSTPNLWAWNDMNEPSVFEMKGNHMPIDCIQTYKSVSEPTKTFEVEHREVHNIYGYGHHKATYKGMVERNPSQNIRPHVLTRSFYAGSQKWTTIWTGDTAATWEYLQITVAQLLALSLCGISNAGGDVGGFMGNPETELAIRWYQLGQFMPFFRAHSEKTTLRREPWLYETKYLNIIKETIKERYRLLPYWYTAFEDHCRTLVPLLRPLWLDQDEVEDAQIMQEQQRFMLGDAILVVPIVHTGQTSIKQVTKGLKGRYYDYYTKKEVFGDEEIECGLERVGCFVKGGHIVPTYDIRSYVKSSKDARESNINLTIAVDENNSASGKLYIDDGESFDYQAGKFVRKTFEFKNNTLTWNGIHDGYDFQNRVTKATILGLESQAENAYIVDGDVKKKAQLIKNAGYITVEFVAIANKDWKIVLE